MLLRKSPDRDGVDTGDAPPPDTGVPEPPRARGSVSRVLSVTRYGGIYVLVVMVAVFSLVSPATFPQGATFWQVLNSNAVPALAALTLVVPLAAGVFDISIANTMSLSGVVCAFLLVHAHWSPLAAILVALGSALLIGVVNALIVVVGKVESLVGTLASGFVVQAVVLWCTSSQTITGQELTGSFQNIVFDQPIGQMTLPVLYALAVGLVIWYVLSMTPLGRRIYATGFNREAARLAGVKTARIQASALVASAFLAGLTGIVITAQLGAGSPTGGNSYLLPAFAGVFVGATQIRPGRFNAWGTVLAVILLGTLTIGLALATVPQWAQQLATGLVLIAALVIAGKERRSAGRGDKTKRLRAHRGRAAPHRVG
ncbi:ABC transporter permease [Pseudonocardia ailaonensis]|uniref:ABC transporter permease n=1 Tax=Pseudonocardia ailaonensis TaxID=367279 RepID=A0ABN2N6K0_9PSEU